MTCGRLLPSPSPLDLENMEKLRTVQRGTDSIINLIGPVFCSIYYDYGLRMQRGPWQTEDTCFRNQENGTCVRVSKKSRRYHDYVATLNIRLIMTLSISTHKLNILNIDKTTNRWTK
ncbi:hypothetical protein BT63DRAFT_158173 [Microthyrium microscopicum]|uniref:Uncharacterized protein n=1 Tax=Microthyrium microscopicum TaxID=703497 RepID=A0A6A6UQ17_9PEZI|nr:hypothetical protein BT63DRAFT_158173 [Microthyrium microscopicum]